MSGIAEATSMYRDIDEEMPKSRVKSLPKGTTKKMLRDERTVGSMSISQLFFHLAFKIWRKHWRGIIFFATNNGLWIYAILRFVLHIVK